MAYTPVNRLATPTLGTAKTGGYTPVNRLAVAKTSVAAKPTLGSKVLGVGKDLAAGIVKPFAELGTQVINIGQEVTGNPITKPFSGKFLGDVNGLGTIDITKMPWDKANLKTLKKSAGVGAEIASTIAGGGVAKDAAGAIVKPTIKALVKEGAIGGASYGAGQSMAEDQNLKDTLKNTALGAVTGAVLAPVISRGSSYISKKLGGGRDLTTDQGIFNYAKKEGGITVNGKGEMPKEGFVVSPSKHTETVIPSKDFKASDITAFKKKFANELSQPDAHLGIWEDNGNKYLDVSHVKSDAATAMDLGAKGDQKAIWDIKGGKAIEVPQPKEYTPMDRLKQLQETPQLSAPKVEQKPIALGGKVYQGEVTVKQAAKNPVSINPKTGKFQTTYNSGGEVLSSKTLESTVPGGKMTEITPVTPKINTNIPETKAVTNSTRMPSIKGNTPTSEAIKINESFVKQGLTEIPPEEMANYKAWNEGEQIQKVTDYMSKDPTFSQNVANGKVPKDVVPQVAYNAVKNKAIAEGDIETQRLLAKNPITTQRSQAASTLRASQVLNDKELVDPVSLIAKNDANIAKVFEKKNGVKLDEVVQKEVKTAMEKKPKLSLKDFISNIKEC
jgi:hypothetical protein